MTERIHQEGKPWDVTQRPSAETEMLPEDIVAAIKDCLLQLDTNPLTAEEVLWLYNGGAPRFSPNNDVGRLIYRIKGFSQISPNINSMIGLKEIDSKLALIQDAMPSFKNSLTELLDRVQALKIVDVDSSLEQDLLNNLAMIIDKYEEKAESLKQQRLAIAEERSVAVTEHYIRVIRKGLANYQLLHGLIDPESES